MQARPNHSAQQAEVQIAYLLLCHENVAGVKGLLKKLLSEDSTGEIFVHYDRSSPNEDYEILQHFCSHQTRCHLVTDRIQCHWGGYSLVEASLKLLRDARKAASFDFFYLLSGSCYPVKPLHELKAFLERHRDYSFMECEDENWIKDGIKKDRYQYRHFLNFRKSRRLFRFFYRLQHNLKLKRTLPHPIHTIRFGSQWWCLNEKAVEKTVDYINKHKNIKHFFKHVWIPDECFFQTVLWHIEPHKIISESLTYYEFDINGNPKIFSDLTDMESSKLNTKFFIRKFMHK